MSFHYHMNLRDVVLSAVLIGFASAMIGATIGDGWTELLYGWLIAIPFACALYFVVDGDE